MRSNDTEVFVQLASQRNATLNMCQPNDFKNLRQDFLAEIFGVPLRTRIEGGRDANNHAIKREIATATKAQITGLAISGIKWLYDRKEYARSEENCSNCGSIVVSLSSEAKQTEMVRNGLVINAMLFTAQILSPRAQPKLYFNYRQWGYTQVSCGKTARSGE